MPKDTIILRYQQRCYAEYSTSIGLAEIYHYPTGNPIRPLPPVQTARRALMIVGAYPSARFESRRSPTTGRKRLIPVADNLQPFGDEVYFDGTRVRRLESGATIREFLLDPLDVRLDDCWVTDLVKVFLFKPEHADSCADVVASFAAPILRPSLLSLGRKSLAWLQRECEICEPGVIVTLGEDVARVVTSAKTPTNGLLAPTPSRPESLGGRLTFHCPHPDACRRFQKWRDRMESTVPAIRNEMKML